MISKLVYSVLDEERDIYLYKQISKLANLTIKWRLLFKSMCLKISILTWTKIVSTLKYHLKIQEKKKWGEKTENFTVIWFFSKEKQVSRG